MTTRLRIEQYLLGLMLMDTSVLPIALDVLKPNNFGGDIGRFKSARGEYLVTHVDVYKAVLRLYPARSVNIIGVVRELQNAHEIKDIQPLIYCLTCLTDGVGSNAAFEEYSFVLVQESIRDVLSQWINQQVAAAQKEVQFVTAGADNPLVQREQDFAQIRHRLQLMPDVFDQIQALRTFFTNYGYAEELEEVEEMASNINDRTRQIRDRRFRINQLNYLRHMAKGCNYPEPAEELIDLALNIIDGKCHPTMKFINQLHQLTALA